MQGRSQSRGATVSDLFCLQIYAYSENVSPKWTGRDICQWDAEWKEVYYKGCEFSWWSPES